MSNWQQKKLLAAHKHQNLIFSNGVNGLNVKQRVGKQIILDDDREMTEFTSCSYLGLDQHDSLKEAAVAAIERLGIQFSVARTRIKADIFSALESNLAQIVGCEDSVTFNAVTPVHLGVLPLLAGGVLPGFEFQNKPTFILDKRAHATMQINRGLLEQFGTIARVDFDDLDAIYDQFNRAANLGRTPISISDSVGSMGGCAPVQELLAWAEKFGGYAYLDDAHGTSVFGVHGSGYVHKALGNCIHPRALLIGSLSKAFGAHGGFIAGSRELTDFVRKQAVTYAFGGPPSLPGIAAALASSKLHLSGEVDLLQLQLNRKLFEFDQLMNGEWVNFGTPFPIRGLIVGQEYQAIQMAKVLHELGIACTAALFPTVALGSAMLRFAISVKHEIADFVRLKNALSTMQYNANRKTSECA